MTSVSHKWGWAWRHERGGSVALPDLDATPFRSRPSNRRVFLFAHERIDRRLNRSPHPPRGIPPAARTRAGELPPRIGRAGPARAPLVRRLRLPDRGSRGGRGVRAARGRLPGLRPRGEARAHRAAPRWGARAAGEPVRRGRDARPLRPRARDGRGAAGRPPRGGGPAGGPAPGDEAWRRPIGRVAP